MANKYGETKMKKLILSASSIGAFRSCPVRFRNAYVYGIRPVEDKEYFIPPK